MVKDYHADNLPQLLKSLVSINTEREIFHKNFKTPHSDKSVGFIYPIIQSYTCDNTQTIKQLTIKLYSWPQTLPMYELTINYNTKSFDIVTLTPTIISQYQNAQQLQQILEQIQQHATKLLSTKTTESVLKTPVTLQFYQLDGQTRIHQPIVFTKQVTNTKPFIQDFIKDHIHRNTNKSGFNTKRYLVSN